MLLQICFVGSMVSGSWMQNKPTDKLEHRIVLLLLVATENTTDSCFA